MKCLAFPVLVVPGHPRAKAEAVGEGCQVTAKTIRDAEKLLHDIRHRVDRPATWNGFSGDESSDDDPDWDSTPTNQSCRYVA